MEPQLRLVLASLASIENPIRSPHPDHEGWLRWTCVKQARRFRHFLWMQGLARKTHANDCSHKTASGELISDRGGLRVQGTTDYGYGVTFQSRKADVHKTLISASKVRRKGHVAVVDSNGGYIVPYNSMLARKIQQLVHRVYQDSAE